MNIHVILKHLQLLMNLLLVYHWYTTNGISHKLISFQKKSIGGITCFVLDPGYLLALTRMQRNPESAECLYEKKVPVLALMTEYTRDVFRNYKNVEVQD